MIVVFGAGAVGLTLGARLARAGEPVLFAARRPEVAARIAAEGVCVDHPESGESFRVRARAVCGIEAAAGQIGGDPVLVCVRRQDAEAALAELARAAPGAVVATLMNDVDNEELAARHFARVIGGVVRQTCTRSGPNATRALAPGRLVVGAFTAAAAGDAAALAERLHRAGYDVGLSAAILEDKWLKLCVNLMSAPNALVRRDDHAIRAFVEGKARLLEEARAALGAEGIRASSCDGRDRSLDEEIAFQRASLARGTSARRLPVYNQVWQALTRDGRSLEGEAYHQRILALAARHGLAAPVNRRALAGLERAARERLGPESLGAEELLGNP